VTPKKVGINNNRRTAKNASTGQNRNKTPAPTRFNTKTRGQSGGLFSRLRQLIANPHLQRHAHPTGQPYSPSHWCASACG
jgi:hypothetical protein